MALLWRAWFVAILFIHGAAAFPLVDIATEGDAHGNVAVARQGDAECDPTTPDTPALYGQACVAISLEGDASTACPYSSCIGVAPRGSSTSGTAIAGTGNASGGSGFSAFGEAYGQLASVSGMDNASSDFVALTGTGNARSGLVAISGTGEASGARILQPKRAIESPLDLENSALSWKSIGLSNRAVPFSNTVAHQGGATGALWTLVAFDPIRGIMGAYYEKGDFSSTYHFNDSTCSVCITSAFDGLGRFHALYRGEYDGTNTATWDVMFDGESWTRRIVDINGWKADLFAFERDDTIYLVEATNWDDNRIFYTKPSVYRLDLETDEWAVVSVFDDYASIEAAAMDSNGVFHMFYLNFLDHWPRTEWRYVTFDGTKWQQQPWLPFWPKFGLSVDAGPSGLLTFAWVDEARDLHIRQPRGGDYDDQIVLRGDKHEPTLRVDAAGNPHVVAYEYDPGWGDIPTMGQYSYVTYTAALGWTESRFSASSYHIAADLALDDDGKPVIVVSNDRVQTGIVTPGNEMRSVALARPLHRLGLQHPIEPHPGVARITPGEACADQTCARNSDASCRGQSGWAAAVESRGVGESAACWQTSGDLGETSSCYAGQCVRARDQECAGSPGYEVSHVYGIHRTRACKSETWFASEHCSFGLPCTRVPWWP